MSRTRLGPDGILIARHSPVYYPGWTEGYYSRAMHNGNRRHISREEAHASTRNQALEAAWSAFEAFLNATDRRVTSARRTVLREVFARHDHFRADELAAALDLHTPRVSRATVYQTLALMVEAGLVCQVRDSDTHSHYEHVHGHEHHEHMVSDRCGRFVEFPDAEIGSLIDKACCRAGFTERTHRVVVFGLCRECYATHERDSDSACC